MRRSRVLLVVLVYAGVLCRRVSWRTSSEIGLDEAVPLLRTGDPAILADASGSCASNVAMLGACFAAFGNDVAPVGVLLVAYVIGPAPLGLPALAVLRRRLRDEAHDIAACAPGQAVEVLGRGVVRL